MSPRSRSIRAISLVAALLMVGMGFLVVLGPVAPDPQPILRSGTLGTGVDVLLRDATEEDRALLSRAGVEAVVEYGDFVLASVSPATFIDLQLMGLVVRSLDDRTAIRLGSVQFDTARGEPQVAGDLRIDSYEEDARGLYLLQFIGPVKSQWVEAMKAQGIHFYNYIPNFAYIVEMDPAAARTAETASFVQWVGIYQPAYRISRLVYEQFGDEPALVAGMLTDRDPAMGSSRSSYLGLSALSRSKTPLTTGTQSRHTVGPMDFSVLVQESAPAITWEALDGMTLQYYQGMEVGSLELLRFSAESADLPEMAGLPGVYWIEPYLRPTLFDEVSDQIVAGHYDPITPGYMDWLAFLAFSGTNVTVAVADTGVDTGVDDPLVIGDMHPELDNRVIANIPYGFLTTTEDGFGHGTHVAGIVAGDNATLLVDGDGYFWGLGIAPNASIVNQRIFDSGGGWASPNYYDLGRDAVNNGSAISSNSWGISSFGAYLIDDQIYDELVRDADNVAPGDQPLIFEISAGNAGSGPSSTGSPGNAKNVITTGASLNYRPTVPLAGQWPADNIDAIVGFSSRGPTSDGRIKPEIVAPGTWVASLLSSASSPGWCWRNIDSYHEYCGGTSMSGPMVSGGAALFVEYWRSMMGGPDPSPALTKAALVNGAVDMPPVSAPSPGSSSTNPIPNFDEGWGRLHLGNVLNFTGGTFYDDQQVDLDLGTTFTYSIPVARRDMPFRVSLAWTDVPGMPGSSPVLVNDLDLVVTAPDGTVYLGNFFSNGWSVPGGSPDVLNNLENVYIPATQVQLGLYTVNVTAVNVPSGSQDYAIVVSHGGGPTSEGDVSWGKPFYKSSALANIVLADIDLNLDNGTQDNALVIATSDQGDSENVNLLEFGTASGVFGGNVQLTLAATLPDDGFLTVVNSGTINVTYNDASPLATVNDTATIDDDLPLISSVQVTNVTHNSARISWLTDENATSVVRYNTSAPPDLVATNGLTTNHSVLLSNLDPNTTYLFEVESTDIAGNTAVDDNATAYYNFTTLSVPPILLVDDDFGDISETWFIDTLNALGESFDYWEVFTQGDPSLGDVQGYTAVIWQASWPCGFSTSAQSTMASYLDGGGRLILSGQDIGFCWSSTSFFSDYLHAVYVSDSAPTDRVVGVAGDPIGDGLDFFINGGDGASNNNWPSVVDPIAPAETSAQYDSGPSTRSAILRVEVAAYSIAYLSFNFEGVSTAANRELLMDRLLDWILPPAFGARLTPADQSGVGVPGGSVTYDLEVMNRGVAQANDTFSIFKSATPYGWPATVFHSDGVTPIGDTNGDTFPDTGPIPSGGSLDLVVQVDIDSGALAGQEDALMINATSVGSISAYTHAWIRTLVPPPGVVAGPDGVRSVGPGTSVPFAVDIENSGAFADVFDLTTTSSLGWPVDLYENDGTTPLTDNNGNGIPDTGTVAGLATYPIVATVSVPTDAPLDSLSTAVLTATSDLDPLETDDAFLRVEAVGPSSPEWPQFHHDRERSGIAPVPFELPLTQRWTAAAGGAGIRWSGPVIYNHTVFFTEQEGILNAVDIGTGDVKWQRTLGYAVSIAGTPAVADGRVYAPFVTSGGSAISLFSLDADTGTTNWQVDSFGGCCSAFTTPAVAVGNVYWSDYLGGTIHAIDAVTGAPQWSYVMGPTTLQGPTYATGVVYGTDTAGVIVALDAFTGAQIWTASTGATITSAPTVVDGVLYVGDYSGSLRAFDALTGAPVWTSSGLGLFIDVSSPVVADGMVFVGAFDMSGSDGWIHALDAATGVPVWSNFIPGGPVGTSVGYNNGSVFLTTWDGNLWAWDALTGGVLQTLALSPAGSTSSVALGDGFLVVGDESGNVTGFSFVGAGVASRVDASPDAVDVSVGGVAQFDAVAVDVYNNSLGGTFTWTSVKGFGTVFPLTPSRDKVLYIAGATAGLDSLDVELSAITASVTVTILPGPLDQVSISPAAVDVEAGDTLQFMATAQDQFGNPITAPTFGWSVTGGIGTIDATGFFTASTSTGAGTVMVTSDSMSATAAVRIVPAPLDQVSISPTTVDVEAGETLQFAAAAQDSFGNPIIAPTLYWSVTGGVGTVDTTGFFTASVSAGTGTVMVSSDGVNATAVVRIVPGPLYEVAITPMVVDVEAGDDLQFSAAARDRYGNNIAGLDFAWLTTGGIGGINATGHFTASTSAGTGTVRVTSDSMNATSVVRVVPGPLDEITVSPSTVDLMVGDSTDLVAVGTDQFGNQIGDATFVWQATIGSAAPAQAGWSATFSAGEEAGTGTITVSSGSVSTTVDVTITAPVLPITQLIQPLTLALLVAVAVLALTSIFLYTRYVKVKRASEKTIEELL